MPAQRSLCVAKSPSTRSAFVKTMTDFFQMISGNLPNKVRMVSASINRRAPDSKGADIQQGVEMPAKVSYFLEGTVRLDPGRIDQIPAYR